MSVELANTAAWLDILYGKCEPDDGVLVFVSAKRNRPHSVHGFGTGGDLVAAAKDVCGTAGLYLKINAMDYDAMIQRSKREKKPVVGCLAEVKTIVSIHLDVDAGKSGEKYLNREHALWAIDQMPLKPTLIVNSNGTKGGFHVYWVLAKPYRIPTKAIRDRAQKLASDWSDRLRALCCGKLDSTSNLDRVLRVVGGKRTDGGVVSMYDYQPGNLYELKDFRG